MQELTAGQHRLANEQARYQIAFREDLAQLAEDLRRATRSAALSLQHLQRLRHQVASFLSLLLVGADVAVFAERRLGLLEQLIGVGEQLLGRGAVVGFIGCLVVRGCRRAADAIADVGTEAIEQVGQCLPQ